MSVAVKRAYDPPSAKDGRRILVDRVWPRGVSKEELHLDGWYREVAPSTKLRTWFGHEEHNQAIVLQAYLQRRLREK